MREWNIQSGDPGVYVIAADVRHGSTNYCNDHIWELKLGGGEPPALAIQTTFGFRARNFRIFPRFIEGDITRVDPTTFERTPTIKKFFPNYLLVAFSPYTGIDVKWEYWVPESNRILGRIQITNTRLVQREIRLQLAALLYPSDDGQRMVPQDIDSVTALCGQTGNLYPVIFMTGGPETTTGPYPALSVTLNLAPGGSRQLTWVQSAVEDVESSKEKFLDWALIPWEPEIAQIEILHQSIIEIETGDPDWDAAFAFGLKQAYNLLVGPTHHLPAPSMVLSRMPDQGYSGLGDGTDYDHDWSGQLPLEADYLSTFLLPASPELVIGLLDNFLETQTQIGFIDLKPGLAGQRRRILATPILTQLAWRIYQATEDKSFLRNVFPKLLSFVQSWFTEQQDRDGDGLPEWAHPLQSGFEDHPVFSQWQPWSQGGDISKVESPSLCAFLYNEIQILIKIAEITEQSSPIASLEALADNLKSAVLACWDDTSSIHLNWDRESHFSPQGAHLGSREGPGEITVNSQFDHPIRLSIRVSECEEIPHRIRIFIRGVGLSGNFRIERLEWEQFRWQVDKGNVSSDQVYTSLETIEITGVNPKDKISIEIMDLSSVDQTMFLPLWAQMLDQNQATNLVNQTICNENKFWKSFGISACYLGATQDDFPFKAVHMIWNNLIGEGLLKHGYQKETMELVTRLMNAVIQNLKSENSFYTYYLSDSGRGLGDPNGLGGLPPLNLFLKTLGVQIISPTKVILEGKNPFPWPVTISYRGLMILRETNKTKLVFPGGQTAIIKSPERREITLENLL
ncbi:hypothetical protein AMJ86_08450 [bacterium SM23_57]|nr:MAG: hypothetical protein AMJ86_08450 [bacterium SM23_57]